MGGVLSARNAIVGPQMPANPANRILYQTFGGLSFANRVTGSTNMWADFAGTDAISGQTYPITASLWGGTTPNIPSLQCIGSDPLNDQTRQIITAPGPYGGNEPVLQLGVVNPYNASVTTQNSFVWYAASGVPSGMVYFRRWLKQGAGFAANMAGGKFYAVCETKTTPSTGRPNIGISSYSGAPQWSVSSEYYANGTTYTNYFTDLLSTSQVPLPTPNVWFLFEAAWRYAPDSSGWIWMAHNGAQVYFRAGQNQPAAIASEKINRIFPYLLYTSMTRPYTEQHARIEVWNAWPTNASPHPDVS